MIGYVIVCIYGIMRVDMGLCYIWDYASLYGIVLYLWLCGWIWDCVIYVVVWVDMGFVIYVVVWVDMGLCYICGCVDGYGICYICGCVG